MRVEKRKKIRAKMEEGTVQELEQGERTSRGATAGQGWKVRKGHEEEARGRE
jgi:hypothetical protein